MKKETFTTCTEAVDAYKSKIYMIKTMIRNLIKWETEYFGGEDKFRAIAEDVTGLTADQLGRIGKSDVTASDEQYGQMKISWEGYLSWSFESEETDDTVNILNTMITGIRSKLGDDKWADIQLTALGITLKQYVARYADFKDIDIKLGDLQVKEYEQEWVKNLKKVGESKFSCKKFEFRRTFSVKLNIWNPNYSLADITGYDYDISPENQELRDRYYEYAHDRFINDYWFDDQPGYLESKRKNYGIA